MKTISMDYEVYEKEIGSAKRKGWFEGREDTLATVSDFLNSRLPFKEWWWKTGAGSSPPFEWELILKAIGREFEWEAYVNEKLESYDF